MAASGLSVSRIAWPSMAGRMLRALPRTGTLLVPLLGGTLTGFARIRGIAGDLLQDENGRKRQQDQRAHLGGLDADARTRTQEAQPVATDQ